MAIMLIIGVALSAAFLFVVLHWWAEGLFETWDAILLVAIFGGLIFGLFVARSVWQFILTLIPLAAAGSYSLYSYKIGSSKTFYKRRCKETMRAIQADPRNRGAREFLADALYNLGEFDHAIDELQVAVSMGAGHESQYKLNKWIKERHLLQTTNPVCRWCRTENVANARVCSKCGSELPYENALSRWLMGGNQAGVRYYLIVVTGLAIVALSLLLLPIKEAFLPVALCCLALGGWALLNSARS